MSSETREKLRKDLMAAGDRRDWDECDRLETALVADADRELIETAEKVLEIPVVIERRWVARKRVVFEDVGVDRWFDIWFDTESQGLVCEESPMVCETCSHWNPKTDLDTDMFGVCRFPKAPKRSAYTLHDYGCAEWTGSDRGERRWRGE